MATPKTTRKTAEEILALKDTTTSEVYVREWDTLVTVIGLTKKQQVDIRKAAIVDGEVDVEKTQAGVFLQGVVEPRFQEEHLPALFDKNAGAIDTILTAIMGLSGMSEGAVSKKEAEFPEGARRT